MTAAILAMAALVAGGADVSPMQTFIAQRLDLTSFPNSTGPRRRPRARTPADYGFTQVGAREGWTVLSENGTWKIAIRLLPQANRDIVVCFSDEAQNGGTYNTQGPLRLEREHDGLFHATELSEKLAACPVYPEVR